MGMSKEKDVPLRNPFFFLLRKPYLLIVNVVVSATFDSYTPQTGKLLPTLFPLIQYLFFYLIFERSTARFSFFFTRS